MPKLGLGIIGLGGRGYGFARMAQQHPDVEFVAVLEPNTERAERGRRTLEASFAICTELPDFLGREDLDAVIVTSADYLHREHAPASLEAGKHVFVDKPLATSVEDGLTIVEAARRSDRVLYMGFNLRHQAVIAETKNLIASGVVGEIIHLAAIEFYAGGITYMARWNRLKKYTGGLFLHKGSHDFDVLNWFNAPHKPARVAAFAGVNILNPDHLPFTLEEGEEAGPNCEACPVGYKCPDCRDPRARGQQVDENRLFDMSTAEHDGYHKDLCIYLSDKDTHDNAVCIIEYENDARAYHSENFVTSASNRTYTVVGERAHLEADVHASTIREYPRWSKNVITREVRTASGGHGGSDPGIFQQFLNCIARGEAPKADVRDGIWSLAVSCAAEKAREDRRVVEIREVLDRSHPLLKDKG